MTGPSTKRLPPSEPGFSGAAQDLINSIFGGSGGPRTASGINVGALIGGGAGGGFSRPGGTVQNALTQRFGFTMPPELLSAFANYLEIGRAHV